MLSMRHTIILPCINKSSSECHVRCKILVPSMLHSQRRVDLRELSEGGTAGHQLGTIMHITSLHCNYQHAVHRSEHRNICDDLKPVSTTWVFIRTRSKRPSMANPSTQVKTGFVQDYLPCLSISPSPARTTLAGLPSRP